MPDGILISIVKFQIKRFLSSYIIKILYVFRSFTIVEYIMIKAVLDEWYGRANFTKKTYITW